MLNFNGSVLNYFFQASPIVKFVMVGLLLISVASWTFIFTRYQALRSIKVANKRFDERFWSGINVSSLYSSCKAHQAEAQGLEAIFCRGFEVFQQHLAQPEIYSQDFAIAAAQRSMHIEIAKQSDVIEQYLPMLATVGSTSPYIGLFGTVWGIMSVLHALGNVSQATIAIVAPGISETLLVTAMGLFAAIPAFVAYNAFNESVTRIENQLITFQEEFINLLKSKIKAGMAHAKTSDAITQGA